MKTFLLTILLLIPSACFAASTDPAPAAAEAAPVISSEMPPWALCAGEVRREDAEAVFLAGSVTVADPEIAQAELLRVPARRDDGSPVERPEIQIHALKAGKTDLRLTGLKERKTFPLVVSDCAGDSAPSKTLQVLEVCEGATRRTSLERGVRNFSVFSGSPEVAEASFRGKARSLEIRGVKAGDAVVVIKAYYVTRDKEGSSFLESHTKKYLVKVAPCREGQAEGEFSLVSD